ncbi:MAG TPA: MotA/TolQ/ExbB proton channel family protein [Kiloniellales bacterium]
MAVSISPAQQRNLQAAAKAALDSDGTPRTAEQHLAWLTARANAGKAKPYHYLLVLRFALVNILGFALLGAAYAQGLVAKVFEGDATYLSHVIFAVFLGGQAICASKIWQASRDLNELKSFDPLLPSRAATYLAQLRGCDGDARGILAAALRLKMSHRVTVVRHVASSLVILGLIGTVIGFIIALSGVHPEQAADVKAITPMVSTLIAGMSTALYTTLVGSVLNVWLTVNYHILVGGTVKLIAGLLEFGEEHGRA